MAFLDAKMQLAFIYMTGNMLSRLPDDIANMPYLCTLDVRKNPITTFSDKLKNMEIKPVFQTILGKGNENVLVF